MFPWFFVILVALCRCLCIWRSSPLFQTLWADFSKGRLLPASGGTLECWVKGWHRVQGENLCNLQGDCGEICWTAGHCGPWLLLLCGCYWQPLLFFLVPRYFYMSQLFLVWVGWNKHGIFVQYPKRLRKLIAYPTLPFLVRGTLSNWKAPFWPWAMPIWGMEAGRQNETKKTVE